MTLVSPIRLSAAAARRIALAAQGFGAPRPEATPGVRQITRVIDSMGLLQLDSVNVLVRSHYLPVFARLGRYPRDVLDGLTAHTAGPIKRRYVEYWAHEASLIPPETFALLNWRMERAGQEAWGEMRRMAVERPELIEQVFATVQSRGPLRGADLGLQRRPKQPGEMWGWHEGKVALEYLFWSGRIGAARRVNFERHYDVISKILPPALLEQPVPSKPDAQRELVRIAARAYGIATEPDLGDYFRLPRADSRRAVTELVEAGELVPAQVLGWDAPAYLWPASRRPRSITARALLSPFDPMVWFRPRALRLFGFHYRIEIYTPAARRVHGYYVLPFLLGDTIVGRVDLKADRQAGLLRVVSASAEPDADPAAVAPELAAELIDMASWLELDGVTVADRGDLAAELRRSVGVLS